MSIEIKNNIIDSIKSFQTGNFMVNAINLFEVIGYDAARQLPLENKTFEEFKEYYIRDTSRFNEKNAHINEWKSIDLLFQLTKEEVLKQNSLFDTKKVDNRAIETYLFFAIELKGSNYNRTQLANITREINKVFPMPVMVLFKYGNLLTLAVINRRLHKRDENKDVLEKVTLIKDISIQNPHRAHIEILFDLSFDELKKKYNFTNFVELHDAWQITLDIKELNKRFFKELANWYFWTTQRVVFPDDEIKNKDVRNATNVIRLITRLIFVWFLKEKKLVSEELFDEDMLEGILKYKDAKKSSYYKAILQNLFFATLNTEMGKRKFRSSADKSQSSHYFIHNLFRYRSEFINPEDVLKKYFDPIPFLNGGLFECLDKEIELNGKLKRIRTDGFSDRIDNVLKVPDDLFFCEKEKEIDLNEIYGTKNKKYTVRGLINILNSYKFTVAENTPIEEEVALDPELLGRVFENLLANYNPETQTTARKQTGSFYTPREIVNYMVDESLLAYLSQKLYDTSNDDEQKIKDLISYSEKELLFTPSEKKILIKAIDNIKILDPACGSGAFPMGILHKLVHILHKVDPGNALWKQRQIEKAEKIDDAPGREAAIETIEEAFENNELDYGRKLYLIENCIYGVDIQPVAVQIAKLRFFISLIVDQKVNYKKVNIGIRPLPNLETKFVAANALIGLKSETANLFTNEQILIKKEKLKNIRHSYFEARTPKRKQKCRVEDKRLRDDLTDLLIDSHNIQPKNAKILASWDPYDQNISAPFFDPEWMFSISHGFDLVIGNPPYIREKGNAQIFKPVNESPLGKKFHQGKMDYWFYFLHNAIDVTNDNGIITFITHRYWINSAGASKLIKRIKEKLRFKVIVDIGKLTVFEAVAGQHMIAIYSKTIDANEIQLKKLQNDISDVEKDYDTENLKISKIKNTEIYTSDNQITLENVLFEISDIIPLGDLYYVSQGVVEAVDRISKKALKSVNDEEFNVGQGVFVLSEEELRKLKLTSEEKKQIIKKYLEPIDVDRFRINFSKNYLIYSNKIIKELIGKKVYPNIKKHLDRTSKFITSSNRPYGLHRPREIYYFENPKIVVKNMFLNNEFALDFENYFVGMSFSVIIAKDKKYSLEYLLGILNSRYALFWFYSNAKHRGVGVDVGVEKLRTFPVKKSEKTIQDKLGNLVKTVMILKKSNDPIMSIFFERIIDGIVYELYLPQTTYNMNYGILKYINNIPEVNVANDVDSFKKIKNAYNELSNPNHPLSSTLLKLVNIPEVKIIEGGK